jgi:eukaryotic-like serine/threonine-protein kinase
MTLERGYLLNQRYRIVEIFGQGGMAAVYRAIDENLGVEVALKENLFTTEEYARQFRREAVILANLRHPNLPRVTDHFVIEQQGQYLVMDYIEGEDLRQRMERLGALPEQEVVIIGVALCDALTYLHSRSPQVLHRDIKPGNVKITPAGQIFLVDFGLAKMVVGRQATTTGARAMTPGYSPPEQYGTARTDHRSDIYSLGATMYSALTNAIPEDGLARAMEQTDLTPLLKRNSKISKRMSNVIEKALEIRPDDRYQSADEFKNDLLNTRSSTRRKMPLELMLEPPPVNIEEAEDQVGDGDFQDNGDAAIPFDLNAIRSVPVQDELDEQPLAAPRPAKKKRKGSFLRSMLLWLFIIFTAAAGVTIIFNPDLPGQVGKYFSSTVLPAMAQVFSPGFAQTPTGTPDFTATDLAMALIATQTAELTPTLKPTNQDTPTPSPSPTITQSPTVTESPTPSHSPTTTPSPTPTGGGIGQIAFVSNRSDNTPNIWIINVDGTGLIQLTNLEAGACQPSWSPDGNRLVFVSPCKKRDTIYPGSSLFIINADGSGLTPLRSRGSGDYSPAWSPDGNRIVFVSLREGGVPQVFIYNLEDNSVIHLADSTLKTNSSPAWSPDGTQIVFVGSNNLIQIMNTDGTGRLLLSRNASEYINAEPIWSSDGDTIIFSQQIPNTSTVWLAAVPFSPDGNVAVKIPNTDNFSEASFSPDGFWIAATGYPDGQRDLYIMTTSGSQRRAITSNEFNEFDPAWRPAAAP